MNGKLKIALLATVLSVGALAIPGHSYGQAQGGADNGNAQNGGNNNGGGGGGGGNRGGRGWDPAQMRQRMIDGIKRQLGSTDDEFAAIEPKLTKVMDIQQDLRSGQRFGGFGGRRGGNGGGGGDAPAPTTPVAIAVKELQDTIDDKDAKPEDIKPKLDALRDAKTKARADLVAAQKDLSDILVQRQEAALVVAGILE